ncbi:MAG: hypothetical protein COA78_07135 [Blastopirellula sp.]|nr:MAG: hypothetical protein COA78_07135 [Blastopirellula sp.]
MSKSNTHKITINPIEIYSWKDERGYYCASIKGVQHSQGSYSEQISAFQAELIAYLATIKITDT